MRNLSIAYGNSCTAKRWSNKEIGFDDLCERLKTTVRTPESVEEYAKMKRADRDAAKDKGGFVGGQLRGGRRKRECVVSRSMLTADLDHARVGFVDEYEMLTPYASIIYTTHGHTPEAPRLRIIVPLTRDVSPDEYQAIARYFAAEWGIDQFDECSYRPHQLMYWPTTPSNGEYICRITEGEWLNPDEFLADRPWRDCSLLPTSSRESEVREYSGKKMEDPLTKGGIVGAFCRAYPITEAIETFLGDVYEPAAIDGRYQYIPADSAAGVLIIDDKFAHSFHASDPACGHSLNSFDLVRIHKFGDDDEKKSFKAMADFASKDEKVKMQIARDKAEAANEEFSDEGEDWKKQLEYDPRSTKLVNSLQNLMLIMENDPALKAIVFNLLSDSIEIKGEVPWKHPMKFWRNADDAQLISYVDSHYGSFAERHYYTALAKVADDRPYHPVREMFEALPPWDGVPRVDTCIIDYLGAEDNEYVRAVTRKALCAAYMRAYQPGIKFDNMIVLNGAQGIGKSTFIARLGMDWFSDSLTLYDMNDKTAAEKLQGYWILEIGELAGMKKADIDKVKSFISRQDDRYRAAFARRVTPHPRQCVFFGTTNSENGYLRDITGNRRFWSIKVSGAGGWKPWDMDEKTVAQIWAEVIVLASAGEKLYLSPELEELAQKEQLDAMEQDDREGLVRLYLDMLLPQNWEAMDLYRRREYIRDIDDPTQPQGAFRRETVSNVEIWCECFGKNQEEMRPIDSYGISAIMARIEGWGKPRLRKRIPLYGLQRLYQRDKL